MLVLGTIVSLGLVLLSLVFHEYAHAYMAYNLGDTAVKYEGRLTFNPLAHIDLYWTLLVPIVLSFLGLGVFGWAKPVSINPMAFKNPRSGEALVALVWPVANFFLALLGILLLLIYIKVLGLGVDAVLRSDGSDFWLFFFQQLIFINLFLWFFNLLPVPPLDGFRLIKVIYFPLYLFLSRYSFFFTLAFIIVVLWPWSWLIQHFLQSFTSSFFSFFYGLFSQLFFSF